MRSLLRAPGILKEPARSTFSHLKKTEYPVASSNERQGMTGVRWIRSRRRPAAARTSSRVITSLRGVEGLSGRRALERGRVDDEGLERAGAEGLYAMGHAGREKAGRAGPDLALVIPHLHQRASLDDVHGLLDLMGVPFGDSSGLDSAKDHFDPSGAVDVLAHEPAVHGSRVKGRRVGGHFFGSHDVLHSTPSFLSRSVSADVRPSRSRRTSSVCWPSSGGGLVISPGVSENFTGTPTSLTFPAVGWTISWTIPRWST